jgi:hypothetical protein
LAQDDKKVSGKSFRKSPHVRRWLIIAALIGGSLLLIAVIALWLVYRATQQPVPWYEEVVHIELPQAAAAGDDLERHALALVSDVKRPNERWEAIFTDEQVNGWLAADLAEKYADALPGGVSDPRVAIDEGGARFACRYDTPRISTVLNVETEVYLTDEPNVVAVRIRRARAGALPLPLKRILDEATSAAQQRGIPIRWVEQEGDPVALMTVPSHFAEVPGQIQVDTLLLRDGEVYIAGRTLSE